MADIFKQYLAEYHTLQALEAFIQDVVKRYEADLNADKPALIEPDSDIRLARELSLDL